MSAPKRPESLSSKITHIAIPPLPRLSADGRKEILARIRPDLLFDVGALGVLAEQVTPAMPFGQGVDLIVERAAWYEPVRNLLELWDGNVYVRFVVTKPNVAHVITFSIAHQHGLSEFLLTHGPGVAAAEPQGEGFLQEGLQKSQLNSGANPLGIVVMPRGGSWWVMVTSTQKNFLWRLHWAEIVPLH